MLASYDTAHLNLPLLKLPSRTLLGVMHSIVACISVRQ